MVCLAGTIVCCITSVPRDHRMNLPRPVSLGLVAGLLIAILVSPAQAVPENQPGLVSSEFIYESAPFPSCHASTIAETKEGLVAAWFGGTHERHPDVGIWVSHLKDGKWTPPVEVANGVESPTVRYPTWNPVLFQPNERAVDVVLQSGTVALRVVGHGDDQRRCRTDLVQAHAFARRHYWSREEQARATGRWHESFRRRAPNTMAGGCILKLRTTAARLGRQRPRSTTARRSVRSSRAFCIYPQQSPAGSGPHSRPRHLSDLVRGWWQDLG